MPSDSTRELPQRENPLQMLTRAQVAQRWQVHPDLVTSLVRRGELTAHNIGGGQHRAHLRFTPAAVEEYEQRCKEGERRHRYQLSPNTSRKEESRWQSRNAQRRTAANAGQ